MSFCKVEAENIRNGLSLLKGKYPEFTNQIDSLESSFIAQLDEFSAYVGDLAKDHWIERVKTFLAIWQSMEEEWGRGRGYRNRVVTHWRNWTNSDDSVEIHNALLRRIAAAWGRVLAEKQG